MSRIATAAVLLIVALVTATGCKSEAESAISKMVDKQKEMVSILKGVTDKASATAAKDKLIALGKEMGEATKNLNLDKKKADDAEMKKLEEKYKPQMDEVGKQMAAEMDRISKIPGAMEEISAGMMGMAGGFGGL
jgi:hypothetical protein